MVGIKNNNNNLQVGNSRFAGIQLTEKKTNLLTTSIWEDENTHVYQLEVNGNVLTRRLDNHMVNGTKLLNVVVSLFFLEVILFFLSSKHGFLERGGVLFLDLESFVLGVSSPTNLVFLFRFYYKGIDKG